MQIRVNSAENVDETMVLDLTSAALNRFVPRITTVEVHVRDANGPKHGDIDKECTIEARLAGREPMAATAAASNVRQAVHDAAAKLQRMIDRDLQRLSQNH